MALPDPARTLVAAVLALASAWWARMAGKTGRRQDLEALVRDAIDYALAHQSVGISLDRTALDAARLGDVEADGRRDFSDAQLIIAIRAELARRGKT